MPLKIIHEELKKRPWLSGDTLLSNCETRNTSHITLSHEATSHELQENVHQVRNNMFANHKFYHI
jgi:hypothetical protein